MTKKYEYRDEVHYPDGKTPRVMQDRIGVACGEDDPRPLVFSLRAQRTKHWDPRPPLPLRGHGELWHSGWDIPTRWAVDADGGVWCDNAHGHPMTCLGVGEAAARKLLGYAERYSEKREICTAAGLPAPMPAWAEIALAAGWTPPEGWKP